NGQTIASFCDHIATRPREVVQRQDGKSSVSGIAPTSALTIDEQPICRRIDQWVTWVNFQKSLESQRGRFDRTIHAVEISGGSTPIGGRAKLCRLRADDAILKIATQDAGLIRATQRCG